MPTRTRAAVTAALVLACSALVVAPASATTSQSVMNQTPSTMSAGEALLIFAGIPLLVVALVWLLVSAPGWTRDGRPGDSDAWTGDAVVVGGASAPAAVTATAEDAGAEAGADQAGSPGGTSATW